MAFNSRGRIKKPARADVEQALVHLELLARMTPREKAEERMRQAKAALTEASNAVLRDSPGAAEQAAAALEAVNRCRAELRALDAAYDDPAPIAPAVTTEQG
jgi:hypothetical protein